MAKRGITLPITVRESIGAEGLLEKAVENTTSSFQTQILKLPFESSDMHSHPILFPNKPTMAL